MTELISRFRRLYTYVHVIIKFKMNIYWKWENDYFTLLVFCRRIAICQKCSEFLASKLNEETRTASIQRKLYSTIGCIKRLCLLTEILAMLGLLFTGCIIRLWYSLNALMQTTSYLQRVASCSYWHNCTLHDFF